MQRHVERLALPSAAAYAEWCRARGFGTQWTKSLCELDREWCVHVAETAQRAARRRVDRDPTKLLVAVCSRRASSRDIARPRWRVLAERIEDAALGETEQYALRILVERVERRGNLLLGETSIGGPRYRLLDGLIALSRECRRWIREPGAWEARSHNASRQFTSLARHLTARYPVPQFLDAAWLRRDDAASRYRDWFVRIGQGDSIRGNESPLPLTRLVVHHFLRAPADYSVEHALRWGQVHAAGGDAHLVEAIRGTRLGEDFAHGEFWSSVIKFFVDHPSLDRNEVGPIVDYLHQQRFVPVERFVAPGVREPGAPAEPHLSMAGRSVRTLLREVERWHRTLHRVRGAWSSWQRSAIGALELETGVPGRNLRVWRIRELLSPAELVAEGRVMRHCVAAYASARSAGHCSLWTVELHAFEGIEKRLTIEVRRNLIVQCRGRRNAPPSEQEWQIVMLWAQRENLEVASYAWRR